jgi:hypothetical protein
LALADFSFLRRREAEKEGQGLEELICSYQWLLLYFLVFLFFFLKTPWLETKGNGM